MFELQSERQQLREQVERGEHEALQEKRRLQEQMAEMEALLERAEQKGEEREEALGQLEERVGELENEKLAIKHSLDKKEALWKQQEDYNLREINSLKAHQRDMEKQYYLMMERLQEQLRREEGDNGEKKALVAQVEARFKHQMSLMKEHAHIEQSNLMSRIHSLERELTTVREEARKKLDNQEEQMDELKKEAERYCSLSSALTDGDEQRERIEGLIADKEFHKQRAQAY